MQGDERRTACSVLLLEGEGWSGRKVESALASTGATVVRQRSWQSRKGVSLDRSRSYDAAVVALSLFRWWGPSLLQTLAEPPILCGGVVAIAEPDADFAQISAAYGMGVTEVVRPDDEATSLLEAVGMVVERTVRLRAQQKRCASSCTVATCEPDELERRIKAARNIYALSRPECAVVGGILMELADKEIATFMGKSLSSVKRIEQSLRQKMSASTRVGIAVRVLALGVEAVEYSRQ